MGPRLAFLEKSMADGSKDPFVAYALAMEYRTLGRPDDAVAAFTKLRASHPDYVPAYLMCGQVLVALGKPEDAREWLAAGIVAAKKKGDAHAAGELADALGALG